MATSAAFDNMTTAEVDAMVAYLVAEIAHLQEHLVFAQAARSRKP